MTDFSNQQEALSNLAQKFQLPNTTVTSIFQTNCEILARQASVTGFIPLLALRRSVEQLRAATAPNNRTPSPHL